MTEQSRKLIGFNDLAHYFFEEYSKLEKLCDNLREQLEEITDKEKFQAINKSLGEISQLGIAMKKMAEDFREKAHSEVIKGNV